MARANIFIKHAPGSGRAARFRPSVCLSRSGLIQQISACVYIISLITLVTEQRRVAASLRGGNVRLMTHGAGRPSGPGPVHTNAAHEREKGGLKPDTHKHWLGVWLLLRTQPVRARFPRHNGLAQTKSVVTGCEANTGNGALAGTGHNDSARKREENRRRNGAVAATRKRLGGGTRGSAVGSPDLVAPARRDGVTSSGLPRPPPACWHPPVNARESHAWK